MKNQLITFFLFFLTISVFSGPFSNFHCIGYDAQFYVSSGNIVFNYYNYRDQDYQSLHFGGNAGANAFIKRACNSNRIKKPFVFVEGFSFDKEGISAQMEHGMEYFSQNFTLNNHPDISQILQDPSFDHNLFLGYSTFNWGTFCTGIDAEGISSGNPLRIRKLPSLLNKIYDASYDIIFVDFVQGTQYIQNNGMALVKVLQSLEDSLQASGSTEKITVCGASMGGLVSRYALNYLHQNGSPDLVDKFISFDSPQRGANIPFSLQCLLRTLRVYGDDEIEKKYDGVTSPAASQMLLTSCLETNLISPFVYTTPQCTQERTELLNDPYFQWNFNAKKISILNGSRQGTFQNNPQFPSQGDGLDVDGFVDLEMNPVEPWSSSYTQVLDFDPGNFTCGNFSVPLFGMVSIIQGQSVSTRYTLNSEQCAGSYRNDYEVLVQTLENLSDAILLANSMNGGIYTSIFCSAFSNNPHATFQKNCFIPAMSAASLKNFDLMMRTADPLWMQAIFQNNEKFEDPNHQITDFDVVYAPLSNQTHVEITDENISWLLTEVLGGPPVIWFQNESIQAAVHTAWDNIKAGRNVGKPNTALGDVSVPANSFVTLRAGERISLEPGFVCNAGQAGVSGTFIAEIYSNAACPKSLVSINEGRDVHTVSNGALFVNESVTQNSPYRFGVLNHIGGSEGKKSALLFKVYPNPTDGEFLIEQSTEAFHLVEVYNTLGVKVKQMEIRGRLEKRNLDGLPAGYYTLACIDIPGTICRLLKQ